MPKETINGITVHYESRGVGDPLLFIHGLGSRASDWAFQVDHFSPNYRVITYDVRGHGESERPAGPYTMEIFARDARSLLDHLGISSAHVVGVSMGGMIAFQLAVDDPSVVRSLVAVNSLPELKPRRIGEHIQLWQRILVVRLLGMRTMAQLLAPRLFPGEAQAALRETFIERWSSNDTRAYLASIRAIIGWGVVDRIEEITAPTLFVAADQDYTPVELKEDFVTRMPKARLVIIEDSRHATPLERPCEFNRVVAEFLSEV
jgi:3-oxoadipate enol-lactonase